MAKFTTANVCFPSQNDEQTTHQLSVDDWLGIRRFGTSIQPIKNDSMARMGIFSGDHLLLDRGMNPVSGDIVVALIDERPILREIRFENRKPVLYRANGRPIELQSHQTLQVAAVARGLVRFYR